MADPTDAALQELKSELRREFSKVNERLTKIERQQTKQHRSTKQAIESVGDSLAWNELIFNLLFYAGCLSAVLLVTGVEKLRTDVCPNLPGFISHAVPFGLCNSSSTSAMSSDEAKIKAFLDTIAWAEGTNDNYEMQFTGRLTASLTSHPEQINCSGDLCSDAAGRYQFLSTTWEPLAKELGLTDFSAESQDRAAIAKLKKIGAYDLILAGKLDEAFCKVGPVWASFPCNDYSQPQKSKDALRAKYQQFLSKYQTTAIAVTGGKVFPIPGKSHSTADFTSGYGPRSSPSGVGSTFHQGYDYAAPTGTPLVAVESGTVRVIKDGGCGNGIELMMKGNRSAVYCHMHTVTVTDGATVPAGAAVGTVGNSGNSTGPHLHIGIKENGQYIDPGDYLKSLSGDLKSVTTSGGSSSAQSYFQELSSGAEFGSNKPKPFGPMRFKVIGTPTPEDRATLAAVVSELNAMGADIQEVQSGENVELHYAPEAQFKSIEPNYRPRNMGYFWRTGDRGRILISTTGVNQQERSHLIREEMTQLVTGLFKDSNRYPDSIFYQGWTATQQYSEIDKQVITMALRKQSKPRNAQSTRSPSHRLP